MAQDSDTDDLEVAEDPEDFDEEFEEDLDEELDEDLDDPIEDDVDVPFEDDAEVVPDAETDDDDDDDDAEGDEALDELEAEEMELVDDEASEALLVDEAAELRAIRREELTLNVDAQAARAGEFVCQSCFLVKRGNQLANRKRMYCLDCAS